MNDQVNSSIESSSSNLIAERQSERYDFFKLGLAIPLITLLVYNSTYNFELGSCRRLFIPPEFIQVDIVNASSFLSVILGTSLIGFFVAHFIGKLFTPNFKKWTTWLAVMIMFCIIVYLLFNYYMRVVDNCILAIVGAWFQWYHYSSSQQSITGNTMKASKKTDAIMQFVVRYYGNLIGTFLLVIGLSGILSYGIGFFIVERPLKRYKTIRAKDSRYLLKRYDAYSIYDYHPVTDSNKFGIIVEYSPDKLDTFLIKPASPK